VFKVEAFVDAAFAIHGDSKSHTGVAVFVGGALVFAASRKQQCMTKSPLTDNVGFMELLGEFLSFLSTSLRREHQLYTRTVLQ
jgi:hypothetical protein